jgi:hypothetical protein
MISFDLPVDQGWPTVRATHHHKGPNEVCHTALRVTTCAGAEAIRDVFEELAAGVEDGPLAVCDIELAFVKGTRRLEDLGPEIPVDEREVANGIGDGRVGLVDDVCDVVRLDVHQHVLCPEYVVAERRGMGFCHPSRRVPLLLRLWGASYLLLTDVGKQHGRYRGSFAAVSNWVASSSKRSIQYLYPRSPSSFPSRTISRSFSGAT